MKVLIHRPFTPFDVLITLESAGEVNKLYSLLTNRDVTEMVGELTASKIRLALRPELAKQNDKHNGHQ